MHKNLIATLWPACGNLYLDISLLIWDATITIEELRVTLRVRKSGYQCLDIAIMNSFLFIFLIVRVVCTWDRYNLIQILNLNFENFSIDRVYFLKVFRVVYLLYHFYRTVFIFLPISHKLGELNLVRFIIFNIKYFLVTRSNVN